MSAKENFEENDRREGIKRRDFLTMLSASFAALTAGGCNMRPPKEKIIPYLELPEGVVPGMTQHYASTCSGCSAACGTLVKTRDGRPIKLEGNPDHPLSQGGLCARGQALILDLYDSERLKGPQETNVATSWDKADAAVKGELSRIRQAKGRVRILSQTVVSPTLRAAVRTFSDAFPGSRHVVYDSLSAHATLEAHRLAFGRRTLPGFHFDLARTIVSFDADFLGTWISPVEFTKGWSPNRRPESEWDIMSWHAQFESRMSVTGANADLRVPIKPSETLGVVSALAERIADAVSWKGERPLPLFVREANHWRTKETAQMLARGKRRSLVVSGSGDISVQLLIVWINVMLENYGATLDIAHPALQKEGDEGSFTGLIQEMEEGAVGALIVFGANPAYDHPLAERFVRAMDKVGLTVSLSQRRDETAAKSRFICPDSHAMESWGDAQPVEGSLSLNQPVIAPLFNSRPAIETFLRWSGKKESGYDFLRTHWKDNVFPLRGEPGLRRSLNFTDFWDKSVERGAVTIPVKGRKTSPFRTGALKNITASPSPASLPFEFVAFAGSALAEGAQANNPWLQELPDPISRACWGNHASFSPADARTLNIVEGRVVRLESAGKTVELPAHIQPGMPEGVVASALGYGRREAGPIAANYPTVKLFPLEKDPLAGADVYPLSRVPGITVQVLDRMSPLAKVQRYDSLTDPITGIKRPHVQETTLQNYFKDPTAGRGKMLEPGPSLWPRHEYKGHKWAMAVDLNACTGCAACVISCQAENNVPVVGKSEVRKSRDMHWLRIDRYYGGEYPEEPSTAFQPMLCQQCDNAPCETVCPVLATLHSTEGINMQVYNRCVGTRYCANNCPYKVRRFNWFDYAHSDLIQNLALNPDITVRTRGVMEKCNFCVQRIQEAKGQARQKDLKLTDGEVRPACMQSCPSEAIVFGDVNDPASRISQIIAEPRTYTVLGELGVGPSVFYQTKVRNKKV